MPRAATRCLLVQGSRLLPLVPRAAHGAERRQSRRARAARSATAPICRDVPIRVASAVGLRWQAALVADTHRDGFHPGLLSKNKCSHTEQPATHRSRYRPWAELMKRAFEIDVLHCGCGEATQTQGTGRGSSTTPRRRRSAQHRAAAATPRRTSPTTSTLARA